MMQQPYAVETSRGPVSFYSVGAPIVGITQDDVDAAEWAAIEAEHVVDLSGYLVPKPSRSSHGVWTWTGIGCGNRTKPNYPAAIARYEKQRTRKGGR